MIELVEQRLVEQPVFPWLADFQHEQAARLKETGFPNRHWENWKYTSVNTLLNANYVAATAEPSTLPLDASQYDLIIQDGCLLKSPGDINGIEISAFDELTDVQQQDIIKTLNQQGTEKWPFVQLNAALLQSGLYIQVSKNVKRKLPFRILYNSTMPGQMLHWCNILELDSGSQLILQEEFRSDNNIPYFNNLVSYFSLANDASLTYYKVQNESAYAQHIAHTYTAQAKNSQFNSVNFSLGAKLARDDLMVKFLGEHASCILDGLYLPLKNGHVDHHTVVDHHVPYCRSEEFYKGILQDKANAVFNGKVIVQPDAQKSEAHQANHNLLLAKTAEINAKPELEIYADDVICSHGATVGQLDKEALFYLQSRGIGRTKAIQLLTQAFAMDVIDRMTEPALKQSMSNAFNQRWMKGDINDL